MTFYAECSQPTVKPPHSFTCWTNIEGLARVLVCYPNHWYVEIGGVDGEHIGLKLTLRHLGFYDYAVALIAECLRVENMLEGVSLEALRTE